MADAKATQPNVQRVDTTALDGLRGLAAFHIALSHMFIFSRDLPVKNLFGNASLPLFYMLSGFGMILSYAQKPLRAPTKNESGALCGTSCDQFWCWPCDAGWCCPRRFPTVEADPAAHVLDAKIFMWKRVVRIAPLYHLTNGLAVYGWIQWSNVYISPKMRPIFWSTGAVTGVSCTQSWLLPPGAPNLELWTISTMLFFYMAFPSIAPRLQRVQRPYMRSLAMLMYGVQVILMPTICAAFLPLLLTNAFWFARSWPPFRLPVFVMGCCAAFHTLHHIKSRKESVEGKTKNDDGRGRRYFQLSDLFFVGFLLLLAGVIFAGHLDVESGLTLSYMQMVGLMSEALFPILLFDLIVSLGVEPNLGMKGVAFRILSSRPATFLGEISMSFYMVHAIVAKMFALAYNPKPEVDYWDLEIRTDEIQEAYKDMFLKMPPWGMAVVLPISLLLGWILTVFVERPCARLLLQVGPKSKVSKEAVVGTPVATKPPQVCQTSV